MSMQVSTDVRRSDLAGFNLHLLPRAKPNAVFVAIVAVGTLAYLLLSRRPDSPADFAIAAFAALAAGIVSLLVGFVISLVYVLFASTEKGGVLGAHTYTIGPDGLREVTSSNETLQRWSGIEHIGMSRRYIYIRINSYLFHVIPRRAFSSDEEFAAFWKAAYGHWKQSAA